MRYITASGKEHGLKDVEQEMMHSWTRAMAVEMF